MIFHLVQRVTLFCQFIQVSLHLAGTWTFQRFLWTFVFFFSYRQLCKSSNTWGCVTVHGFSDSVTSIGKSEKNFHKVCADSVTLVLSPSDRCWLFTDTWTPTRVYTLCFYITLSLICTSTVSLFIINSSNKAHSRQSYYQNKFHKLTSLYK